MSPEQSDNSIQMISNVCRKKDISSQYIGFLLLPRLPVASIYCGLNQTTRQTVHGTKFTSLQIRFADWTTNSIQCSQVQTRITSRTKETKKNKKPIQHVAANRFPVRGLRLQIYGLISHWLRSSTGKTHILLSVRGC